MKQLTTEEFNRFDKIAHNAVQSMRKRYSFWGSLTKEDLKNYAWLGILSAIKQPKYENHENKSAYVFVFARGYCQHALHRKSRMIKTPNKTLQDNHCGHSHLSYSWDNLPEARTEVVDDKLNENAVLIASTFSKSDQVKILNQDFQNLSKNGKQLLEVIRNQYNMETIYE